MRRRARPGLTRLVGVLAVLVAGITGCAGVSGTARPAGSRPAPGAASSAATSGTATSVLQHPVPQIALGPPTRPAWPRPGRPRPRPAGQPTAQRPVTAASPAAQPLAGQVIALDPGHNGANWSHPAIIDRLVNVLTEWKACDTAGAQTDAGYPEHAFTFDVAKRLARLLRAEGATVVLTRHNDHGVGPCVTQRAAIGNRAHADVAISIHADGGPPTGTGFEVISPGRIAGAPDTPVIGPSGRLAVDIRNAYHRITREPYSDYVGTRGLDVRTDLGGLNLSTVPKVFIECGNMRNAADAARLTSPRFRERIAVALAAGFTAFLNRHS